ncbi:MAG: DUF3000 family protein [Microbacteriaceae bacterium]|nr:DUF3000 family protein [Microbacteriaceae bacterium]
MTVTLDFAPAIFTAAADQIRNARLRRELNVREIAAPARIAPHAVALGAGINRTGFGEIGGHSDIDSAAGAGRLILLHDPEMVDEWGSDFRFVCYAQAPLELEIITDPFIADVAWSWLMDALHSRGAEFTAVGGTATTTLSTGYGALAGSEKGAQVQLRASWTPGDEDFEKHAQAWSELLCLLSGLPHEEGVASFNAHR